VEILSVIREINKTNQHLRRVHAEHQPGEAVASVEHVSVRFNNHDALEDIDFHLAAGERLAIIGPNGAGKSTLLKVMAGVLTPSRGQVRVYGTEPGCHICIAYVPQRTSVDWNFPVTVADVVMMGRVGRIGLLRAAAPRDWQAVRESLEMVNLAELYHRPINELSGGQAQRMFIARAIAQEAELVLMDEPLTGLDIQSEEAILALLDKLKERNIAVAIALHDLKLAAERFDRVLLLNRRMVGIGTSSEVFQPALLQAAYGDHLRMVQSGGEQFVLEDTCCDHGEESHA
jgi:manganese/iron transport system ATP-binding protein